MVLENGQHYDGDILVGADGIWSEVKYTILFFVLFRFKCILVHIFSPIHNFGPFISRLKKYRISIFKILKKFIHR